MEHSLAYFLCSSLIPELRADISAGAARDVHPVLVGIAAFRAPPDELSVFILGDLNFTVVSADLTVIALRVKLSIHDMIVYELHYR